MKHVVISCPIEPGRFLVCRVAHGGQLTAVEDCNNAALADRRAVDYSGGPPAVRVEVPFERPRQLVMGFYTDADAGG